jgi:hypothetical protein
MVHRFLVGLAQVVKYDIIPEGLADGLVGDGVRKHLDYEVMDQQDCTADVRESQLLPFLRLFLENSGKNSASELIKRG